MSVIRRLCKKLRERRGMNEYIQVMLVSVMIATLISFGIQVWTLLSLKGDMSDTAVELARFIELHGAVDSEVYNEFDRLKHVTGRNVIWI